MHASKTELSQELKNGIEVLVGQVVLKLQIKTVKIVFWLIARDSLGLLYAIFEFLRQFSIRCIYYFS